MNSMNKKKLLAAAAIVAFFGLLAYNFVSREGGSSNDYIMEKGSVSLRDIRAAMKKIEFNDDTVREYFSSKLVNPYTIEFFNSLQHRFGTFQSLEDHFNQVREYLYSVMSPEDADRLMELYRSYIQYQKNIAAAMQSWDLPAGPDGAVDYLRKIQEYRRNYFGKDTADILFGASVMAKEYSIRRVAIVYDDKLYGKQKEDRIKQLNEDMWGEEKSDVEGSMSTFAKYQEKLQIYRKDLEEISEAEKGDMIAKFRSDLFTDEQIERFQKMDTMLAAEKQKEESFRAQEEKILQSPNLTAEEKGKKIEDLQEEIFGEEAEDFRRRETFKSTVIGQ